MQDGSYNQLGPLIKQELSQTNSRPIPRCGPDPVPLLHPSLEHPQESQVEIAHKGQNPFEAVHLVLTHWPTPSWLYASWAMHLQTCPPNTVQRHQGRWAWI